MKIHKLVILKEGEFDKLKNSDVERLKLVSENEDLRLELDLLEALKSPEQTVIPIDLGDPVPESPEEYDEYVGRVAGFYKDILGPKLTQMLSTTHNELEDMGNDRESDLVLKGIAYSFREIMKWGNGMVSKQIATQIKEE